MADKRIRQVERAALNLGSQTRLLHERLRAGLITQERINAARKLHHPITAFMIDRAPNKRFPLMWLRKDQRESFFEMLERDELLRVSRRWIDWCAKICEKEEIFFDTSLAYHMLEQVEIHKRFTKQGMELYRLTLESVHPPLQYESEQDEFWGDWPWSPEDESEWFVEDKAYQFQYVRILASEIIGFEWEGSKL